MKRIVQRMLPDGQICNVQPFHVCLKGLEQAILCRDADDYDAMVKVICVCARRKNVRVIIYCVVSNHCHVAVLAKSHAEADSYANEIKRIYSLHFQKKYRLGSILRRVETKAICLDSDQYVRNALAYIPQNAADNGALVHEYPWSGFRAMFSRQKPAGGERAVAVLTFREKVAVMHTGDNLTDVPWLLDKDNRLIPSSFCDCAYLEQVYQHDPNYFLRLVGGVNAAEMQYELEEKPYQLQSDSEYLKTVEEVCRRWFKQGISSLSETQKRKVVPYLFRTTHTTVRQLARTIGLPPETIASNLRKNK